MKLLAAALLVSSSLFAQDFVGRWTGVADTTDEGGTKRQERQAFEIRSEGDKLVGSTIGRNGAAGSPIQVQTDGAKLNLYRFLDFEGGEHLRWKLEFKDGKLVGTFSALHDSPKKWVYDRIGAMTVTKNEAPASK